MHGLQVQNEYRCSETVKNKTILSLGFYPLRCVKILGCPLREGPRALSSEVLAFLILNNPKASLDSSLLRDSYIRFEVSFATLYLHPLANVEIIFLSAKDFVFSYLNMASNQ